MILPTFSEEQILSELVDDFKRVKRIAKKKADAYLYKVKKNGRFIREKEYESYTVKTVLNNVWDLEIEYDQTKKIPWSFRASCIVESDKKTKDFYLVRGLNSNKPYFVKITSHALKRVKERNKLEVYNITIENMASLVFEHREIGICMKYIDLKYNQLLQGMDDIDEIDDLSYIVLVNRGVYYATKTPCGNYIFKTYISSLMGITEVFNFRKKNNTKWAKEGELLYYMLIAHQYYNKSFYDKEVLENSLYSVIKKGEVIELKSDSAIILLKN